MRHPLFAPLLAGLLFTGFAAQAADNWKGTIVATTTKNNADTAAPFSLNYGARYMVQCDAAAYVRAVTSATGTVTTSNGVKVAADEKYDIDMLLDGGLEQKWIAAVSVSGTANCKVFLVTRLN